MKKFAICIPFILYLFFGSLSPLFAINFRESGNEFPVLYKDRFRPAEAYARLWLTRISYRTNLKSEYRQQELLESPSPLFFLFRLNALGYEPFKDLPLFRIDSAELKKYAHLPVKRSRFSFRELYSPLIENPGIRYNPAPNRREEDERTALIEELKEFKQIEGLVTNSDKKFIERISALQSEKISPVQIDRISENEFPLSGRLKNSGVLFRALPPRPPFKEWVPLNALALQVYDVATNRLKPIENFTAFSDTQFESIRKKYLSLARGFSDEEGIAALQARIDSLSEELLQAYLPLAGKTYRKAHEKKLLYPTKMQLTAETIYFAYPWIYFAILAYAIAGCLILASSSFPYLRKFAYASFFLAITLHGIILLTRCYILQRPPVSNMYESVLYVPWIASLGALILSFYGKQPLILLAASLASVILLLLSGLTDLDRNLDQVQAVLDSRFWLSIHVMSITASYGIFILGAVAGHFYLVLFLRNRRETSTMHSLGRLILQAMYGGITLLISGTILGGIWATESWGRFWDWDPKESWAFISACIYLIWIHAYRFRKIRFFGLAVGSIIGLTAIGFTWYGVNYILGTGLHSYGFGSGGEFLYYGFVATEILFLTGCLIIRTGTRPYLVQ